MKKLNVRFKNYLDQQYALEIQPPDPNHFLKILADLRSGNTSSKLSLNQDAIKLIKRVTRSKQIITNTHLSTPKYKFTRNPTSQKSSSPNQKALSTVTIFPTSVGISDSSINKYKQNKNSNSNPNLSSNKIYNNQNTDIYSKNGLYSHLSQFSKRQNPLLMTISSELKKSNRLLMSQHNLRTIKRNEYTPIKVVKQKMKSQRQQKNEFYSNNVYNQTQVENDSKSSKQGIKLSYSRMLGHGVVYKNGLI